MEQEENRAQRLEIVEPSAIEALERANIDIQISTARKFPRSLAQVKTRMLNLATLDEETAASCFYALRRQGKSIDGPSIRLAEIAACSYGNLRYGARVIANDGKQITAQGFAHDLETNVLSTIEIKRRITDKTGQTYSDDMQVVTGNAACAIAARNAVFKVVPFAFVKPVYLAARKTAVGDITTLAERRTKMLAKFASIGVNEKQVCASVEKTGLDEIGLNELETLVGVWNAINDGESTVEEAFPKPSATPKFGAALPKTPETTPPPATTTGETTPDQVSDKPPRKKAEKKPEPERATPVQTLRALMTASGVFEKNLLVYLFANLLIEQGVTIDKMPEEKIKTVIDSWLEIAPKIEKGE